MDLSGYLAIVRRWWWTLIVAAWIAGLTGWLVASTIAPTYESHGWTPRDAGLLMSVFAGTQFVSGLLAPALLDRVPTLPDHLDLVTGHRTHLRPHGATERPAPPPDARMPPAPRSGRHPVWCWVLRAVWWT